MKKGVLSKSICFLLFLIFLCTLSWFVFAVTPPEEPGIEAGEDIRTDESTTPSDSTFGYWIVEDERIIGDKYGGEGIYYSTTGREALVLPEGRSLGESDFYDVLLNEPKEYAEGWNLVLPTLYSDFYVNPAEHEIHRARFVLDPKAFEPVEGQYYPSHTLGGVTFESYQTGCVECSSIDDLDTCTYDLPKDTSCIGINILNKKDCSVMADYIQPYCEGVVGIGGNQEGPVDPGGNSKPGFGGCRIYEIDGSDANQPRSYSRDWFLEGDIPGSIFSDDFTVSNAEKEDIIRHCCGNDPEDAGAIAKHPEMYVDYPNAYICFNDTFTSRGGISSDEGSPEEAVSRGIGNFKWGYAQDTNLLFRIINIDRLGSQYDAVSNSNDWYICNTGDGSIDDWYTPVLRDSGGERESGILLDEYEGLPKSIPLEAGHTDILEGLEGEAVENTGTEGDAPGTRGDSIDDIIDEESFSTTDYDVSGAAAVTACDKDGDGYDGDWSLDPVLPQYDGSGLCEEPRQPYDCDDGEFVDGVYVQGISRMKHPGRVDYCIGGVGYDLDCDDTTTCKADPTGDTSPGDMAANPDAIYLNPRFICHNTDEKGEFAECCGWDLGFCFNPEKGRREGSAVHTLREFDRYGRTEDDDVAEESREKLNKMNFVLRYGINRPPPMSGYDGVEADAIYWIALFSDNHDLDIKNWRHYKNLEFYVWFTSNYEVDMRIGQYTGGPGIDSRALKNYVFPFQVRITDYVVNEPELRKWLHVIIPIDEIFQMDFEPDVIVFASNVRKLMKMDTIVTINGDEYSNVVGIDKIFLKPKEEDIPGGAENFYCSGTWPPVWITDLDDKVPPENADQPAGRDACESIPSYGWTGSMCCGDDTGKDTYYNSPADRRVGPLTQEREFYADTDAGCWAGNVLADNSRVMLIKYNMFYYAYSGPVTRSCRNTTCIFDLPPVKNTMITNDHAGIYDLSFVNGGTTPIGRGGLSPNDYSLLKADNVPMQVLYFDGDYWGCNADDFVTSLQKTGGGDLIPVDNRFESPSEDPETELDMCSIKGAYFCDHADGADTGWNDETLNVYPDPSAGLTDEGIPIYNFTMRDGTAEKLTPGVSVVSATNRIEIKRNYNLIKNGGFENV